MAKARPAGALTTKKKGYGSYILTFVFIMICIAWLIPIIMVVINSFKTDAAINQDTFGLPNADTFSGVENYIRGATAAEPGFWEAGLYTLVISILSTALILVCTSMAAWYVVRVNSIASKIFYYLCIFSMIVPFQMVMYPLVYTSTDLRLNTPWTIPVLYLGFGAGLAVFMFSGFVKGLPLEIEEAAAIDGCGPVRTFFSVVLPMLKPTLISVGILELMWVWNDYLLPYLVLDRQKYATLPIYVQMLQGDKGHVDMGGTMAMILLSILPIIIVYLFCQKYIIKGVAAGAVKG